MTRPSMNSVEYDLQPVWKYESLVKIEYTTIGYAHK